MENYIVIDIETTGVNPQFNKITEIGAVKVINNEVIDTYSQLVCPECSIPKEITRITGIDNELVKDKPTIDAVLPEFIDFCEELPILGHNVLFDISFIKTNANNLNLKFEKKGLDTLVLARKFLKDLESRSLTYLIKYFKINRKNAHRAFDDALATHELFKILKNRYYSDDTKKYFKIKPLHYKVKKDSPITDKQIKYLEFLTKKYNVSLDKDINLLSKSEASKAIDSIKHKYGA